jgi:hypothetical protein
VELSEGTRPRYPINSRGDLKARQIADLGQHPAGSCGPACWGGPEAALRIPEWCDPSRIVHSLCRHDPRRLRLLATARLDRFGNAEGSAARSGVFVAAVPEFMTGAAFEIQSAGPPTSRSLMLATGAMSRMKSKLRLR